MKYLNVAKKFGAKLGTVGTAVAAVPTMALAQGGPDYSVVTAAVDWAAVGTAILLVFAAIAAVLVVFKGGKLLLKAIR